MPDTERVQKNYQRLKVCICGLPKSSNLVNQIEQDIGLVLQKKKKKKKNQEGSHLLTRYDHQHLSHRQ